MKAEELSKQKENYFEQAYLEVQKSMSQAERQLTTAKQAHTKETEKAQASFILEAIKRAGQKELADKMILDSVRFGRIENRWIVIPESRGITPSPIKKFHAIALLRNLHRNAIQDLVFVCELATVGDIKLETVPEDKIRAAEIEIRELKAFHRALGGTDDLTMDLSRSVRGADTMTPLEAREYIERLYMGKRGTPMTQEEALAVSERLSGGSPTLSPDQMKKHISRNYKGDESLGTEAHFGPA